MLNVWITPGLMEAPIACFHHSLYFLIEENIVNFSFLILFLYLHLSNFLMRKEREKDRFSNYHHLINQTISESVK